MQSKPNRQASAFADHFLDPLAAELNRIAYQYGSSPQALIEASTARAYYGIRLEREINKHVLGETQ